MQSRDGKEQQAGDKYLDSDEQDNPLGYNQGVHS